MDTVRTVHEVVTSALIQRVNLTELRWLVYTLQDYLDAVDNGGWEKVWYTEDGSPRPKQKDAGFRTTNDCPDYLRS